MSKKKKTLDELLDEALVPEDEQPYEIPEKWRWTTVDKIAFLTDYVANGSFASLNQNVRVHDLENYAYYVRLYDLRRGIGHSEQKYVDEESYNFLSKSYLRGGELLLASVGSVGAVYIMPSLEKKATIAPNMIVCRVNENINKKFIYYYLKSPIGQNSLEKISSGSTQIKINKTNLKKLAVPIPVLREQKRISEKIEILFAKIDEANRLIDEVSETFKIRQAAILEQAFSGELTVDFKIEENFKVKNYVESIKALRLQKYNNLLEYAKENNLKKPSKPKSFEELVDNSLIRSIPTKWGYTTLGQVVYDFKYGTSQKSDYSNQGQPVIRIPNIGEKYISVDDLKFLSEDVKVTEETIEEGDLLIIRSNGSRDLVGKCAIVDDITSGYAYASYLIRMRPIGVNSKFIYWLLKSNFVKNQLFSNSKSSAGINNINTQELASIVIPLPSLEEQNEIVEKIEYLINKEKEVICSLPSESTLEGLKQAILSKAFKGELGTNNPIDEPAIELLKSILQKKL